MVGTVKTTVSDGIATVSFGHPASNSFPSSLLDELTNEFNRLRDDNQVVIIVLKSQGENTFCAGAFFGELLEIDTFEKGKAFFSGFANLLNAMRKCSKIIIGRVHGKSVGGGVGLISACDYVIATNQAVIKLSELTIGIGPFVIAPFLERRMGRQAFSELALMAHEWKDAIWAKENGLYTKIVNSITDLDRELSVISFKLASYNPDALLELKKILWEGTEHWDELVLQRASISGKLVLSPFTKKVLQKKK